MLPTIDISLIGVFLAVFNVVKIIWDYVSKALTWVMHQALALLIGSKFWATAAFLTAGLVLIHFVSLLLTYAANQLYTMTFSGSYSDSGVLQIIDFLLGTDNLLSTITYCVSCWLVYRLVVSMDFTRRVIQHVFTTLSKGWKT